MSPKDLKTIHFLNKMIDAGVSVFKIEGRARSAEYVAETVGAYSEAITAVCDGSYSEEKIAAWDSRLEKIFNRGFWDGYYLGQRLGEWSAKYGSSATRTKFYSSKAMRYFPKLGVGEFLLENGTLSVGDEVVRLDLEPVQTVSKGDRFSMPVPAKIRPADRLYRWHTNP